MIWKSLTIYKIWLLLLGSWFMSGAVGTLAGLLGFFYPWLSVLLIFPVTLTLLAGIRTVQIFKVLSPKERITLILVSAWWLLHSLQVFVPETGFDALWYHLPLAQQTVTEHRFLGTLEFYQSFNPQFSDSIFYLSFAIAGEKGAKVIAYLFGITLVMTTYILSRNLLKRSYALLVVLLVSSFQVVSWQSSSFYIDLAKAFWELSALILIIQKQKPIALAGLVFGASLASKLFSILLLPIKVVIVWFMSGKKQARLLVIFSLVIVLPYYFFAYQVSGNTFYSATHHADKLAEIGGTSSTLRYIIDRTVKLPLALWEMIVSREYTSPIIVLFFPLVIMYWKTVLRNQIVLALTVFSLYQILLWWYIPPTSSRYALSGFITALIVVVHFLKISAATQKRKELLFVGLVAFGLLALPIRLAVAHRSWQYLSGAQTNEQYLRQFYDGNVDTVLKKWHKLD